MVNKFNKIILPLINMTEIFTSKDEFVYSVCCNSLPKFDYETGKSLCKKCLKEAIFETEENRNIRLYKEKGLNKQDISTIFNI